MHNSRLMSYTEHHMQCSQRHLLDRALEHVRGLRVLQSQAAGLALLYFDSGRFRFREDRVGHCGQGAVGVDTRQLVAGMQVCRSTRKEGK